jgi:hypothetical protein
MNYLQAIKFQTNSIPVVLAPWSSKDLYQLRVSARGREKSPSNDSRGIPPLNLSVILRHLEAELSIQWCLKLIRGLFPLLKKILIFYFPLKVFLCQTLII